jgi:hypothetical protein
MAPRQGGRRAPGYGPHPSPYLDQLLWIFLSSHSHHTDSLASRSTVGCRVRAAAGLATLSAVAVAVSLGLVRMRLPQQRRQGRVLFRLAGPQRLFRAGKDLDEASAPAPLVEPEAVHDQRVIRRRGRSY